MDLNINRWRCTPGKFRKDEQVHRKYIAEKEPGRSGTSEEITEISWYIAEMWVYIEPEGDEAIWKRKDAAGKGEIHRGELNWSFSRAGKGIKDLLNINAGIKSAKAEIQENKLFWGKCKFQKRYWNTDRRIFVKIAQRIGMFWFKICADCTKRFSCPTGQIFRTFMFCNK